MAKYLTEEEYKACTEHYTIMLNDHKKHMDLKPNQYGVLSVYSYMIRISNHLYSAEQCFLCQTYDSDPELEDDQNYNCINCPLKLDNDWCYNKNSTYDQIPKSKTNEDLTNALQGMLDLFNKLYKPKLSDTITISWHVDDILHAAKEMDLKPPLTKTQAREILQTLHANHDPSSGITWDTIHWEIHRYLKEVQP